MTPQPQICDIVKKLYDFTVQEFTSAEDNSEKEEAFMRMLDLFPQTVHARTGSYPEYCSRSSPAPICLGELDCHEITRTACQHIEKCFEQHTHDAAIRDQMLEEIQTWMFMYIDAGEHTGRELQKVLKYLESLRSSTTKETPR